MWRNLPSRWSPQWATKSNAKVIVPLGEGADGNLVFEQGSRIGQLDPTRRRPTLRFQQSLGGSDTHGQELVTVLLVKPKMSITLQRRDQFGQAGNQELRTGILDGAPGQKEHLLYHRAIDRLMWTHNTSGPLGIIVKEAKRICAFVSCQFNDLIQ